MTPQPKEQDDELEQILEKVFTEIGIILRRHPENEGLLDDLETVGENQIRPMLLAWADKRAAERERVEEIKTLEWVLSQLSFDGSDQDVKYIEDRINTLKGSDR